MKGFCFLFFVFCKFRKFCEFNLKIYNSNSKRQFANYCLYKALPGAKITSIGISIIIPIYPLICNRIRFGQDAFVTDWNKWAKKVSHSSNINLIKPDSLMQKRIFYSFCFVTPFKTQSNIRF
jgi:hypothetical protein